MKVMMMDIGNYASRRIRWVSSKEDEYATEVIPDVWDASPWAVDIVKFYQNQGYEVFLFSTIATNRLQQVDIMEDLCRVAGITRYFADDDQGCVIDGKFMNGAWRYQTVETEDLAIDDAITYITNRGDVDEFFITTDSRFFKDICEKRGVKHQWIGDTHSIALA